MKLKIVGLVVGLQMAWVLGMVVVQERMLTERTLVLLETRPVDPRDLLRGDFVILNYRISDLPRDLFVPPLSSASVAPGQLVYVALERTNEFHQATAASLKPMPARTNAVVVRGRTGPRSDSHSVHVIYGLERFFVREGTGNPTGPLTVEAAVSKSGQPAIKQVYVSGIPYAEAMRTP